MNGISSYGGVFFLVIVTPLMLKNNIYIIEILKDITQKGKILTKTIVIEQSPLSVIMADIDLLKL